MATATLFDRLGGVDAVQAAVEEMYTRLLADDYTVQFFETQSMARLKVGLLSMNCMMNLFELETVGLTKFFLQPSNIKFSL